MTGKRGTLEDRFWAKVEKRGDADCWPWLATKNNYGYGLIWSPASGRKNKTLAHRVSYELHCGPIPDEPSLYHGTVVMHSCDNPGCVNPAHLSLGTQALNTKDMDAKKRRRTVTVYANLGPVRRGEAHGMAKLTAEKVLELRRRRQSGETFAAMARELGMNKSTIRKAVIGQLWRSLD